MNTFGSRNSFAIEFELIADPDAGRGASLEEEASWGRFRIWLNDINICQQTCNFTTNDAVAWYLYPVLEWFSKNWYPVLFEEQPPFPVEKPVARTIFFEASKQVFGVMDDEKGEALYSWGQRHSFRACSNGGIFPDLFIRAIGDSVEFSWGNAPIPGIPQGFYFNAPFGSVAIKREIVRKVMMDFSDDLMSQLIVRCPASERLKSLRAIVDSNKEADRIKQIHWMIPALRAKKGAENIIFETIKAFIDDISEVFVPAPVLMYGTLSPEISARDVEIINTHLHSDKIVSDDFLCFVPAENFSQRKPYEAGYDLAQDFSESFRLKYDIEATPETIVSRMNVQVIEERLSDSKLRGIALAGKHVAPKIFLNINNVNNVSENGRRFSIAHEICHLLYDRQYGQEVGISSGPWAPLAIEQRANAFAAMLLMPMDIIEEYLQQATFPLSFDDILSISLALRVSPKSLVEHLYNVGVLDYSERDSFRDENQRRHL